MSRKISKKSHLIPTTNNNQLRVHPYNQRYDLRPRLNRINYSEVRPQRQRNLQASSSLDGQGDHSDFVSANVDNREIPTPEYMSPPESDDDYESIMNATVADDRKSIKEEIEDTINDSTSNVSVEGEEESHSANVTDNVSETTASTVAGWSTFEEDDYDEISEPDAVPNTEENFQRNYSASVFDYQELVGNPTMLNLAPRSSQSAIRNNIDPVDDIRDIDHFAGGDGPHNNQTNVIEISIRILNEEEDESDREQ